MVKKMMNPETRKNILKARKLIEYIDKKEANEAETRKCIYDIFEMLGYTPFKHITQEHAISGTGDDERCDIALRFDEKEPPKMLVEIKRVSTNLSSRHLKQVKSYAINKGSEWALLTNAKIWQLYHITYEQPPILTMICSWNILTDDIPSIVKNFDMISYKNLKKGVLDQEWIIRNALSPNILLKAVLLDNSIKMIRRNIRQISSVFVSRDVVIEAIKKLLNEKALSELENKIIRRN